MYSLSLLWLLLCLFSALRRNVVLAAVQQCDASKFTSPVVPGAEVLSITAEEKENFTTLAVGPALSAIPDLHFCEVKVYLTHPGADDKVLVQTWLPLPADSWNDRFQAIGGGGFSTGMLDFMMGVPLKDGYATSSTDGGHPIDFLSAEWVMNADKTVNWDLLHNFGSRSIADNVHVGKSITEQFYGRKPHHSYFNGCSQGGRQGYVLAQRYPGLVDGIMASAPALRFPGIVMASMWPEIVMREANILISNCEFDWFDVKALEECDILDGAIDGVIGDRDECDFDPTTLVGQKIQCGSVDVDVTRKLATTVRKIREGPATPFGVNIFPGYPWGISMSPYVDVKFNDDGIRTSNPLPVMDEWARHVLLKDRSYNTSTLTYTEFLGLYLQTNEQHGWLLNTDNADLTAFRDAGSKLLSWHGTNDAAVPYQLSTTYRERLEREMGGPKVVNDFHRLFLAPGVEHCALGAGAVPKDPMAPLVEWVENGVPPDSLEAETTNTEGELVTRELCMYPGKPKYMGLGDAKRASSWSCVGGAEEEAFEDDAGFIGGLKDRLIQVGLDMGLTVG